VSLSYQSKLENIHEKYSGSNMTDKDTRYWQSKRVEVNAAGFSPDKIMTAKAVVTIASPYTNAHRCNNRVNRIAELLVDELSDCGAQGFTVGAPAVSDAMTQGSKYAGYSLVSRDLVADCVEVGHYAHRGNAMMVISGCDKSGAAALMPLARANDPGLVLYAGTGSPGSVDVAPWDAKGNNLTILDYVEAGAAKEAGIITTDQFDELEKNVMPGSGTCGAMFTANTMSVIIEAMGMMLPFGASHPADYDAKSDIHDDVKRQAAASVKALLTLVEMNLRPRDIMTMAAFENAIVTAYAMGGSTNMYLHLLAIAQEAEVPLTVEMIQKIGEKVPLIANLQPHGPYAMVTLHNLGGVPVVMKELLENGYLHGDVMTVSGTTLSENLKGVATLADLGEQDIVYPVNRPIAEANNHVSVLKGNIATESCLLKLGGKTLANGKFRGPARVFDSERAAMTAIQSGDIIAGDVVVVRYVGPVGEPGMPEMVALTVQLQGRGLGKDVALITDGRFSGVSHGILIGHISPEAAKGGPIAAVHEGDTIVIDPVTRTLQLDIDDAEIAHRLAQLDLPEPGSKLNRNSVLRKYTRLVSSAHHGCVTAELS
jgi:dihydroxy-acid dehydratase